MNRIEVQKVITLQLHRMQRYPKPVIQLSVRWFHRVCTRLQDDQINNKVEEALRVCLLSL